MCAGTVRAASTATRHIAHIIGLQVGAHCKRCSVADLEVLETSCVGAAGERRACRASWLAGLRKVAALLI